MTSTQTTTYRYEALTPAGQQVTGTAVAVSDRDARQQLANQGLLLLDLTAAPHAIGARSRLSARDLAVGLRMLANLVDSGMPMVGALDAFKELAPPSWTSGLPHVVRAVTDGHSISQALTRAPSLGIPATVVGLVRAGEAGGGLAAGLRDAAEWAERRSEDRSALRNALAYPAMVAGAGVVSIVLMVALVLPRFARMLSDLGQTPPRSTMFILRVGELARAGIIPALFVGMFLVILVQMVSRGPDGRRRIHELILRIPIVGKLRFASASSSTLSSLAALLGGGVPISTAITLAGQASGDAAIERRMLVAHNLVARGESLARSLSAARVISNTSFRLVAAGEESSRLVQMLAHAGLMERSRAVMMTRQVLRILEPTLLLVVSSVVGIIATAMLQAVYSVKPSP